MEELASLQDYISAMEQVFEMHSKGKSIGTEMLHFDAANDLEFHLKAGGINLGDKTYFGLKINGASFHNMEKYGLPNIIGAILLFDGECGYPLAIVDSIQVTIMRTGATTAVAAKYLARKESKIATICGTGNQGRIQLQSIKEVLPLEKAYAYDMDFASSKAFSTEMSKKLDIEVIPVREVNDAASKSDVIITCTPSKKPYILADYIQPGTFIGAIGADSPDKQEIDEKLLVGNKVVVDILDQCAKVGELHHGIEKQLVTKDDVAGELGDVISGKVKGRSNDEEITIYDATGTALQDTAAAAMCYKKAVEKNLGIEINLYE